MRKNVAASVHQKLINRARETGRPFDSRANACQLALMDLRGLRGLDQNWPETGNRQARVEKREVDPFW